MRVRRAFCPSHRFWPGLCTNRETPRRQHRHTIARERGEQQQASAQCACMHACMPCHCTRAHTQSNAPPYLLGPAVSLLLDQFRETRCFDAPPVARRGLSLRALGVGAACMHVHSTTHPHRLRRAARARGHAHPGGGGADSQSPPQSPAHSPSPVSSAPTTPDTLDRPLHQRRAVGAPDYSCCGGHTCWDNVCPGPLCAECFGTPRYHRHCAWEERCRARLAENEALPAQAGKKLPAHAGTKKKKGKRLLRRGMIGHDGAAIRAPRSKGGGKSGDGKGGGAHSFIRR